MLVNCCYRLVRYGEVIHSYFDTIAQVVIDMPTEFIPTKYLYVPVCNEVLYPRDDSNFDAMCEAVLLSNDEYAFVYEMNNRGYYALEWNGCLRFLEAPTDMRDRSHESYLPHPEYYKCIGFRTTRVRQYRSNPGIYRLVSNKDGTKIYTNDGVLTPQFNVNELSPVSFNYKGYKDCVAQGHYGVVYYGEDVRFVDITPDKKLILV